MSLLTLLTAFTFVAAACGDDSGSSSATTGGGAATTAGGGAATTGASGEALPACGGTKDVKGSGDYTIATREVTQPDGTNDKIGLMYDVTGRGDFSFNDSAAAGLDKAKADFGIQASESTPTGEADRAERLKLFVDDGNGMIIAVGFLWGDTVTAGGAAAPDTAVRHHRLGRRLDDRGRTARTCVSMTFAEQEGSFLVGAAAAMKSETGHIGFIGGVENDLIKKFEAGYVAGAKQVNPDITVDVKYISQPPDFSGFNDPAKGKEIAAAMYQGGADIVYAAAGGSGLGMFQAAKEYSDANNTVVCGIGVDSDQILTVGADLEPYVMTSMLKRVDVAVYNTIADYLEGSAKVGTVTTFDLKIDGVAYSTTGGNLEDIVPQLEDLKSQIVDGTITVPTAP